MTVFRLCSCTVLLAIAVAISDCGTASSLHRASSVATLSSIKSAFPPPLCFSGVSPCFQRDPVNTFLQPQTSPRVITLRHASVSGSRMFSKSQQRTRTFMAAEQPPGAEEKMQWVSALSVGFDTIAEGLDDAIERCKKDLDGAASVDLATVFISSRYSEARGGSKPATNAELKNVINVVQKKLGAKHVIGCLGGGVVGSGDEDGSPEEFENFKALSVAAASLPGSTITPFRVRASDLPNKDGLQDEWRDLIGNVKPEDEPSMILLSDPEFSRNGDLITLLEGLDFAYSGCPKVGGIAAPSPVAAIQIPTVFGSMEGGMPEEGQGAVVGVALTGNVEVEPIVAQGCSAIGPLLEVSSASGNIVREVMEVKENGGSKPMMTVEALKLAIEQLSPQQAQLAQTALFVGIASDDFKDSPGQGDFLIRQVVGVQVSDGSLVVGDVLRPGQRIRFHIRDRDAAVEEVEALMAQYKRARLTEMMKGEPSPPAAGLLMFTCVGRGRALFNEANYDSRMAYISTGVPVAGVFCNGEIGPVSGKSHLHGFTSVFSIVRPRGAKASSDGKADADASDADKESD